MVPTTGALTTTTGAPAPNADHGLDQPPAAVLPPLPPGGLGPGDTGDVVKAYQDRMAAVRLDPGARDGVYREATTYAVDTVQRLMHVEVTGRIGLDEAAFLAAFHYPEPLHPDGEPDRTEISVTDQLMTLYGNSQVRLITMISTGSGVDYCYDTPKVTPTRHVCAVANTPSGRFAYYEKIDGWQDGDLGTLYNPVYFDGGIAVHGADHVSLSPQSYGCINIPMHIADYFPSLVSLGDAVYVDGGAPAPTISDTPIASTTTTTPPTTTTVASGTTTTVPPEPTTTTVAPEPTTTTCAPETTTPPTAPA